MYLSSISLENYRSYKKAVFQFSPKITVVIGENTAGKTNILEAVFLLSIGKPFRVQKEAEVINWGNEFARINGNLLDEGGIEEKIELSALFVNQEKEGKRSWSKKFTVNKVPKRQIDFIGKMFAVLFSPSDLDLISGSPSLRRRYLDSVLLQIDRNYRRSLTVYEKGIRQRNKLLEKIRDEGVSRGQLLFWNDLIIKNGQYISNARREFINFLNHLNSQIGVFTIHYDQSEISFERLEKYAHEEVMAATTLVGPHRDDFKVYLLKDPSKKNGLDLNIYASRGEQRMGVLWLKFGEYQFIKQKTNSSPLLILDDIFSELDEIHRQVVLDNLDFGQTIISTTDFDYLKKHGLKDIQIIRLSKD